MSCDLKIKQQSEIYIGDAAQLLSELLPKGRVVVISDVSIDRLHHSLLAPFDPILIGTGETIKTLATAASIYQQFVDRGVDRSTFVLGIGGGIVTDVAGFVASTYMRGLKFGFVSTTLLSQVDASIGGKNGVNLDGYKNMVGTFNQPQFVICDVKLLKTLPDREFRAGLSEIVKAGVIADASLFTEVEHSTFDALRKDNVLLRGVILSAMRVKADIVERDECEHGERRKLNLGHTFAHAIEKSSSKMNHGEAVAVGMAMIADLGVRLGVTEVAVRDRIVNLLVSLGFDIQPPVAVKSLLKAIDKDKKSEEGTINIVLPTSIGSCEVRRMTLDELKSYYV